MTVSRSITAAVLTDLDLAGKIGKKGGESDITIFDHKKNEFVLSLVVPHRFPEKLPPLLFALGMSDVVVLSARELTKTLAEEVVATELFAPPGGIIHAPGAVSADQLAPLLKGTVLEKYPVVNNHFEVADYVSSTDRKVRKCDGTIVLVDQAFEVKGVGTVVLGKVHAGPVKVNQKLQVLPKGPEVSVRSIQIHDDDHDAGPAGVRVGLALRGAKAEDLSRGTVLAAGVSPPVVPGISGAFASNKFFKPAPAKGQVVHVACGLDAVPARIEEVGAGTLNVVLERPIVRVPGLPAVVASLDAPGSKIIGAFR